MKDRRDYWRLRLCKFSGDLLTLYVYLLRVGMPPFLAGGHRQMQQSIFSPTLCILRSLYKVASRSALAPLSDMLRREPSARLGRCKPGLERRSLLS